MTTPRSLPARPRLLTGLPAIRRPPDAVQFGTDVGRALVLDGLTPPLRRMVTALDGTRHAREVVADAVARGVAPGPAQAVLDGMSAAGLLGAPTDRRSTTSVLVHGRGRLVVALVSVLAGAAVGAGIEIAVAAPGRVGAGDTGTGLTAADIGRPMTEAVAAAVPGVGAGPGRTADLVVLAGAAAADPAAADELVAAGRAHLAVTVRDGVGHVGPLVLPGRGACLRCVELARADADPAWPVLLAQLACAPPEGGVADATVTAALAAAQVVAAAEAAGAAGATGVIGAEGDGTAHAVPPTLGGVLDLDTRRGSLRRTAVPVHPECRCRARPAVRPRPPVPGPASLTPPATVARVA